MTGLSRSAVTICESNMYRSSRLPRPCSLVTSGFDPRTLSASRTVVRLATKRLQSSASDGSTSPSVNSPLTIASISCAATHWCSVPCRAAGVRPAKGSIMARSPVLRLPSRPAAS